MISLDDGYIARSCNKYSAELPLIDMSNDLTGIIKSTGVALEHEAFRRFGAAVEEGASGALRGVFGLPPANAQADLDPVAGQAGVWAPTRYAAALVKPDQVDFNPKLKFLFKISFEFDHRVLDAARRLGHDVTAIQQNASFMVRHVDRPKFDFDYEDVNLYNYRTKVLKQIRHREIGFTLYDDVGNNVLSFINVYRKLVMPIARSMTSSEIGSPEDFGLAFDTSYGGLDTAMRGVLPGGAINVLRKMTIHQIFVERGSRVEDPSSWVKVVDFVFINPRFTNIDIDDLDHENGANFNIVTCTADFDTMFMDEPRPFTQGIAPSLPTGDITANANGSRSQAGGDRNPFVDIIVNQGSRLAQQAFSNVVNRSLGTSAGGRIIAGEVSRVGGVLAEAGRRSLSSLYSSTRQSIAAPARTIVRDSNTPSDQVGGLTRQEPSSDDYGQYF